MENHRLLKFAVVPLALGGALVANVMPANAQILGAISQAGQVEFAGQAAFYFKDPGTCVSTGCDYTVTGSSGIFSFAVADADNAGNLLGLPTRTSPISSLSLPSLAFPGPTANGGVNNSCLLLGTVISSAIVPDWTCSGTAVVPVPDATTVYSETLLPFGANKVTVDGMDAINFFTVTDGTESYTAYLTQITRVEQDESDPFNAETTVSGLLKWENNVTGKFLPGLGSVNSTFVVSQLETAWSSNFVATMPVPEPSSVLGLAIASGLGVLLRKKQTK
jgi:hypothetical protein